ncbi:MMPL family transporter [Dehalococcoidia bacterium]|nr:MMPL family transporter [Dehalococcoidia bacterium]
MANLVSESFGGKIPADQSQVEQILEATPMVTAISRIGRAVVITALTTLGGFGVLIASDFVLIRDFGIATVSGVFLCLISSMLVMPPLLVFFDERVSRKKGRRAG